MLSFFINTAQKCGTVDGWSFRFTSSLLLIANYITKLHESYELNLACGKKWPQFARICSSKTITIASFPFVFQHFRFSTNLMSQLPFCHVYDGM